MRNVARQQRLADLRARIAVLEKRPLLPEGAALLGGKGEQDAARGGDRKELAALLGAPAGLLHEIHAEGQRDSGAAFGFALGLACQLLTPARPAIALEPLRSSAAICRKAAPGHPREPDASPTYRWRSPTRCRCGGWHARPAGYR